MISTRWKLWGAAGMALAALSACGPGGEAGETGHAKSSAHGEGGEAGEAGAAAPPPPAAAAAAAAGAGGEQGEAGAADAYSGMAGAARTGLRLQHLKGFLLVADKELRAGRGLEGIVLAQQGVLEVVDPAPGELAALDLTALRTALAGDDVAKATGVLRATLPAIDAAAGAPDAERVRRMLALARGLYSGVVSADGVDPVEYQHSLGAALGAADALAKLTAAKPGPAAARATAEMDALLKLWPTTVAPDKPSSPQDVAAAAARVELALSGIK